MDPQDLLVYLAQQVQQGLLVLVVLLGVQEAQVPLVLVVQLEQGVQDLVAPLGLLVLQEQE